MTVPGGIEAFLDHYQLTHDPFAARTPGFKFFTPQRKNVLAELHHLARFGNRALLVTGPHGSGKTLLRQALVASTNKDTTQCVVTTAKEFPESGGLMGYLCQAVNASGRNVEALLDRAEQLHETGVQLYLIIDDAELLEQQALQDIVDLCLVDGEDSALRLFLFADPRIDQALDKIEIDASDDEDSDLADTWVHRIALQPYSLEETRDYIAQRLDAAGQGIELVDDAQLEWVHDHSGGWPGLINSAAMKAMQDAMDEQERAVEGPKPGLPLKTIAALVLVGAGVAFAWWMGDQEQQAPVETVLQLPEATTPAVVNADPELAGLTKMDSLAISPAASETPVTQTDSQEPQPLQDPVVIDTPPVPDAGTPPVVVAGSPAAPSITPSPVAEAQAPVAATPAASRATESSTTASTAVPAPVPSQSDNGAWYREAAASEYVLQLLGSRSQDAAKSFISRNSALADLDFFETRHEGQPWFVVTQGRYATRQQAQAAIAALPEPVKQLKPWPRSVGNIQSAMQ